MSTMDESTQIEVSDLSSHTKRMDTLQRANAHATARSENKTMRALEQEDREARRERYPAFLEELIEAMRRLRVMAEARAEVERQMEVETQVEVEAQVEAEEVDGAGGEASMDESTCGSDTQALVLASSQFCIGGSRNAGRDLAVPAESMKAGHGYVLLDKKTAVSEPKVEEEEVQERDQSWAMMALTHDDECWVKPDRDTDLPCPCR